MAIDIAATSDGDIKVVNGDIVLTGEAPETTKAQAVELAQRVYFALKTEIGDFLLHPDIGQRMNDLMGYPNNQTTAENGKALIMQALSSVGLGRGVVIETWPGPELNKINYEITITFGTPSTELRFVIGTILTR